MRRTRTNEERAPPTTDTDELDRTELEQRRRTGLEARQKSSGGSGLATATVAFGGMRAQH